MLTTYPVLNGPRLGQQVAQYSCPPPTPDALPGEAAFPIVTDPTLNCMRDARGNTVCSDGMRYPPGCPKTPPPEVFSPGITPDVTTNGMIEGQVPPPKSAPVPAVPTPVSAPAEGPSPLLLVGAGALGAIVLGTAAYFILGK